jgi:uncharacterized protein
MSSKAEFSVPVSELDAAGKAYAFPIRAAWIRGELEGNEATTTGEDGQLEVRLSRSGNDVVVHGHLHAELTAPCARCLNAAKIPIDAPLSLLMVPESKAKSDDKDDDAFDPDEADVVPFDGETVVLDDIVRDELVLQIPMIPLCSEDCTGMSQAESGLARENAAFAAKDSDSIDPRLLPLLRFKKSTKE